jgi:hypothetical protein
MIKKFKRTITEQIEVCDLCEKTTGDLDTHDGDRVLHTVCQSIINDPEEFQILINKAKKMK